MRAALFHQQYTKLYTDLIRLFARHISFQQLVCLFPPLPLLVTHQKPLEGIPGRRC